MSSPWSTAGDEDGFDDAYGALLDYVRAHGTSVGDEEIESSDVILPPADLTLRGGRQRIHRRGPDPRLSRSLDVHGGVRRILARSPPC